MGKVITNSLIPRTILKQGKKEGNLVYSGRRQQNGSNNFPSLFPIPVVSSHGAGTIISSSYNANTTNSNTLSFQQSSNVTPELKSMPGYQIAGGCEQKKDSRVAGEILEEDSAVDQSKQSFRKNKKKQIKVHNQSVDETVTNQRGTDEEASTVEQLIVLNQKGIEGHPNMVVQSALVSKNVSSIQLNKQQFVQKSQQSHQSQNLNQSNPGENNVIMIVQDSTKGNFAPSNHRYQILSAVDSGAALGQTQSAKLPKLSVLNSQGSILVHKSPQGKVIQSIDVPREYIPPGTSSSLPPSRKTVAQHYQQRKKIKRQSRSSFFETQQQEYYYQQYDNRLNTDQQSSPSVGGGLIAANSNLIFKQKLQAAEQTQSKRYLQPTQRNESSQFLSLSTSKRNKNSKIYGSLTHRNNKLGVKIINSPQGFKNNRSKKNMTYKGGQEKQQLKRDNQKQQNFEDEDHDDDDDQPFKNQIIKYATTSENTGQNNSKINLQAQNQKFQQQRQEIRQTQKKKSCAIRKEKNRQDIIQLMQRKTLFKCDENHQNENQLYNVGILTANGIVFRNKNSNNELDKSKLTTQGIKKQKMIFGFKCKNENEFMKEYFKRQLLVPDKLSILKQDNKKLETVSATPELLLSNYNYISHKNNQQQQQQQLQQAYHKQQNYNNVILSSASVKNNGGGGGGGGIDRKQYNQQYQYKNGQVISAREKAAIASATMATAIKLPQINSQSKFN